MANEPNNHSTTQQYESLTVPSPRTNGNGHNGGPLEKDFSNNSNGDSTYGNPYHLGAHHDPDDALKRIHTAGSISISPELFEKIYLSPKNRVHGDLRKTFANPTPLALIGFLLSLMPLSCDLMGWRGAGGNSAAGIGTYYFFGGLLMVLGGVGEWIMGNTFPFVVFTSFGAFWLGWAATLQPFYNAYGAYSTTSNPADGIDTVGFHSSFAFFFLAMAMMCLIYLICSLRTNICFVFIFLTLFIAFCCLAGAYWNLSLGKAALASRLQITAGACAFVTSLCGWWIFFSIMLAALDFPFQVPIGDLSHFIKGASERADENV
ncbi:GPR1/FUN34/YaaH-class plasma membrane protein [Lepidopterella palustris CBS 459.81]|uniref:GPR1/FUN34/YaaH-class plasma membrane protein n=1 Tax=Lepidopterella palustris CBS 459.81 TaxID=1314670 RepID=A0A8E2DY80_9PEZI|nr:GPR1/FUN34/YaaH-class plasma membrane protein [Lepidopterella palustris CBS 459.81]